LLFKIFIRKKVFGLLLKPFQVVFIKEQKYFIYFQHHVNAFVFLKNTYLKRFNYFANKGNYRIPSHNFFPTFKILKTHKAEIVQHYSTS